MQNLTSLNTNILCPVHTCDDRVVVELLWHKLIKFMAGVRLFSVCEGVFLSQSLSSNKPVALHPHNHRFSLGITENAQPPPCSLCYWSLLDHVITLILHSLMGFIDIFCWNSLGIFPETCVWMEACPLTPPETLWQTSSCRRRTAVSRYCSEFPHFFSLFSISSYLLLLCLHLPLYLPSSLSSPPLLKRLSSGMRWRSYRPLAAHLLNCQQLRVKRDLTETLSHNVCVAAEECDQSEKTHLPLWTSSSSWDETQTPDASNVLPTRLWQWAQCYCCGVRASRIYWQQGLEHFFIHLVAGVPHEETESH